MAFDPDEVHEITVKVYGKTFTVKMPDKDVLFHMATSDT
jgi:hypothetical protein